MYFAKYWVIVIAESYLQTLIVDELQTLKVDELHAPRYIMAETSTLTDLSEFP